MRMSMLREAAAPVRPGAAWRWALFGVAASVAVAFFCATRLLPRPLSADSSYGARRMEEAKSEKTGPRASAWRWAWVAVVAYVVSAFMAVNYLFPVWLSADDNLYIAQPSMWGLLAVLSFTLLWKSPGARLFSTPVTVLAVFAAAFYVACLIGAGTATGFGYSPYARQPLHMVQNGLYIATFVAGLEFSRAYLVSVFYRHSPFLTLTFVSLIYAVLVIPTGTYDLLGSTEGSFRVASETLLPTLALSVAATYLVAQGGPLPAVLYRGGVLAFQWFSPILPRLEWTAIAFVGTVSPVVAVLAVRSALAERTATWPTPRFDVSAPWVVASATVVALFWFSTGMFGVQPAAVSGVSMEPTMSAGDLVLTREVDPDALEVGDVVRFDLGRTTVVHRIVEIEGTSLGRVFVTKGDNNNTVDSPILAGQIEGEVMLTVPKLGWLPIMVGKVINGLR